MSLMLLQRREKQPLITVGSDDPFMLSLMALGADGIASAVAPLPPGDHLGGYQRAAVGSDDAAAVGVHAIRVSAVSAVLWGITRDVPRGGMYEKVSGLRVGTKRR